MDNSGTSPNGSPPNGSPTSEQDSAGDGKARLTDQQKRKNHIQSEQKRRTAIRKEFDGICEVIPGLQGMGRSEGLVLNETTLAMLKVIEERKELIAAIEARGGTVPDSLRATAEIDTSGVNFKYLQKGDPTENSNNS